MKDRIQLTLMHLIPKHLISRWAGKFARSNFSRKLIPAYAKHFKINVSEAEKEIGEYPNLLEFFIRRLKPGSRPMADGADLLISPVDGRVAVVGGIERGMLLQAKGIYYTVAELLGGDRARAKNYEGGNFLTIYLSPSDYHRIHMPLEGQVTACTYVPGTLFPVNAFGVRAVQGLFAKNERLITYLKTSIGEIALIKVGATIVGSVRVVYDSVATNLAGKPLTPQTRKIADQPNLAKGAELALFEFGSTVILLFPKGKIQLDSKLDPGKVVRMGETLGKVIN